MEDRIKLINHDNLGEVFITFKVLIIVLSISKGTKHLLII